MVICTDQRPSVFHFYFLVYLFWSTAERVYLSTVLGDSTRLDGRRLLPFDGLDPGHHLLLCNEMVDSFKQTEQALHVAGPLIEHLVSVSLLLEANQSRRTINLCVDGLADDQLANVLLRLLFAQVEELREALEVDAGVVFGDNTDIVLDDALAEVQPALMCLGVAGLIGCVKDVGGAEVGTVVLRDMRPTHELRDGEEVEEGGVAGNLLIPGVAVDTMEEV